ncbi:MAG: cation:proton antiporter [Betaproteobacteria bacterium]|nr:cation:proton antiporter [Betaproteobacteria bacterium]
MTDLQFLPSLTPPQGSFVLFGLLLLSGLAGGHLFARVMRLPRITGYIVVGIVLGPSGLEWLSRPALEEMRIFVDIALGLVLFDLGRRIDIGWLRKDRWLLATGVTESTATFFAIFLLLGYLGVEPAHAAMAAAIGVKASPAVLMLVARDLKAQGQVTERALILVAINSALAFFLFTMFWSYLHLEYRAGWLTVAAHPVYVLAGSLTAGWIMAQTAIHGGEWLGKRPDSQFILIVALIVIAVGLTIHFKLSALVTLLAFGILAKNLDRKHALLAVEFGQGAELFFVILFVFAGATLQLELFPEAAWIAVGFVAVRFAAKLLVLLMLAPLNGLRFAQAGLLGLALVPMSGTAVVMVQSTAAVYPEFGARLAAIVLSAVAILEIIGPVATHLALRLAGEASPDTR